MRILFLDLDTLRPDHLGCYGYGRNTSPNIDGIAKEGVKFENYYCSDAPCLPSRAALMTGQFGIHTGVVGHGGTAADMRLEGTTRDFQDEIYYRGFITTLRKKGFRTVSVSTFAERHAAWWFNAGFNELHNVGGCGVESAEKVTPTVLKWIEDNAKEDNWFLHVNYWDAHTPYRAPKEFGNPFENEDLPQDWITEEILKEHRDMASPHGAQEIMMYNSEMNPKFPRQLGSVKDLKEVKELVDGYDCGVKYMDENIGSILKALEKQGVLDDLAIIVTADHGENIGEIGSYSEHSTADNITCKVPMIIKWPGGRKGETNEGLHYNLDLPPTMAELLGAEPSKNWDGESYAKTIFENEECGREYLVLSQCAHVCQRSVRFGEWIYMRTYHDGYHLYPKEMLFNVKNDPHEINNLANERKDICLEAVYKLNEWHDDMMMSMSEKYDEDPLWTVIKEGGPYHARGQLKNYCERLEKTGRGHRIEELKKRHPREFK